MNYSAILVPLIESIQAIHSPSISNQDRLTHLKNLEAFKSYPNAIDCAYYISHQKNGFEDRIRHFGLSFLTNQVNFNWTDYSQTQQSALKEYSKDLLLYGLKSMQQEPVFIKEKCVQIFVSIAKRLWPSLWLDMDAFLCELYALDSSHQELVLLIYRSIAQDLYMYEDKVAEARKSELVTALTSVAVDSQILNEYYSKSCLEKQLLESGKTELIVLMNAIRTTADNQGWLKRWISSCLQLSTLPCPEATQIHMLSTHLTTLTSFLDWIYVPALIQTGVLNYLLEWSCHSNRDVQMKAIESLALLFLRNMPLNYRESLLFDPLFKENGIQILYQEFYKLYHVSDYTGMQSQVQTQILEEQDYLFFKILSRMMSNLVNCQVCYKKNTVAPLGFDLLLNFIWSLTFHSSKWIVLEALDMLLCLFKHEELKNSKELVSIIPNLFNSLFKNLTLITECEEYDFIDFESKNESKMYTNQVKQKVLDLFKMLMARNPLDSFTWIHSLFINLWSSQGPHFWTHLEAIQCLLDCCLGVLPAFDKKEALSNTQNIHHPLVLSALNILKQICVFQIKDLSLTVLQLQIMSSLSSYFELDLDLLLKVLESVFNLCIIEGEGKQVYEVRRKAISSLIKIAKALPNILMALYPDILAFSSKILDIFQSHTIERHLLYEFLVVILYYSEESCHKQSYFDTVLGPMLKDGLKVYNEPMEFIDLMGVLWIQQHSTTLQGLKNIAPPLLLESQSILNKRSVFRGQANILWHTLGSYSAVKNKENILNLWNSYIDFIFPFVFVSTRQVISLWNPEYESCTVLQLCIKGYNKQSQGVGGNALEYHIETTRKWISHVKEALYHTIALFAQGIPDVFYGYPNMSHILVQSLFQNASHLPSNEWKSLISIVFKPLLVSCKPIHYTSVLIPFLSNVFKSVSIRLESEWKVDSNLELDESPFHDQIGHEGHGEEQEQVSEEIYNEMVKRQFTRAYADLLSCIFERQTGIKDPTIPYIKQFKRWELVECLTSDLNMVYLYFSSVCQVLSTKDMVSCGKMIHLLIASIPCLLQKQEYQSLLGKELLSCGLQALHDGHKKDIHNDVIHFIADTYYHCKQVSRNTFAKIPGMSMDSLQAYEVGLAEKSILKERIIFTRSFLEKIIGKEDSQLFSMEQSFSLNLIEKKLLAKPPRDSKKHDLLDQEDSAASLDNLFES